MVQQLDSNISPEQSALDIAKEQSKIMDNLEKIIESLKRELLKNKHDIRLLKEQIKYTSQDYY